jgi:hypothetical protein
MHSRSLIGTFLAAFLIISPFKLEQVASSATTELISLAYDGTQANGDSWDTSISADGRYVAFASYASNLVIGDANNKADIFVRDRDAEATELVSIASDGTQGNGDSRYPSLTPDARFVLFTSAASSLVDDDTNNLEDIFVRDRQMGTTERVNVASNGTQADDISYSPVISPNGRFVAFTSDADNLAGGIPNNYPKTFVRDRVTGMTEQIGGFMYPASISADGRYVLLNTDGPPTYIYNRLTRSYELVSIPSPDWVFGSFDWSGGISTSADWRYVLFYGGFYKASGLFVHDRQTNASEKILDAPFYIQGGSFSQEARFVVWGPTYDIMDISGYDRLTHQYELISVGFDGSPANGPSGTPSVSDEGGFVAFVSYADNLVSGDTNDAADVFLRDRRAVIFHPLWWLYLPFTAK